MGNLSYKAEKYNKKALISVRFAARDKSTNASLATTKAKSHEWTHIIKDNNNFENNRLKAKFSAFPNAFCYVACVDCVGVIRINE